MGRLAKRHSFNIRSCCKWFLFQVLIILVLFAMLIKTKQYTPEDLRQETIFVCNVEYVNMGGGRRTRTKRYLILYTDDNSYQYSLSFSDQCCGYSVEDLEEKLQAIPLNILVKERLFYRDSIVEAHNEQDVFYSLDNFNQEMQRDRWGVWICFGVVESVFLSVAGFFIYLDTDINLASQKHSKKRKTKK